MNKIVKIDIKNLNIAQQILKLQLESYKIESKIIDYYDIPPLNETIEDLLNSDEMFYTYNENKQIIGVISFKVIDNVLDIHKLFIEPKKLNNGIGTKLLNFIKHNFNNVEYIKVQTAYKNIPAINFYKKNGFQIIDKKTINNNLDIVSLRTN